MTEGYLQILQESLEKKIEVLKQIIDLEKAQLEIASSPKVDYEIYDESVTKKGKLIDELNRLDDGFVNTYELIKDDVMANKDKYPEQVQELQRLIRVITDMIVEIQAAESRNKQAIELATMHRRQELKQKKISTNAAIKYYKAMSRINTVDPQLMDHRK